MKIEIVYCPTSQNNKAKVTSLATPIKKTLTLSLHLVRPVSG
jgi:hypothetical protein